MATFTKGTNCGFVTTAPTADPTGPQKTYVDDHSIGIKDTSPATTAQVVTEIGFYSNEAETKSFDVAIYTHDSGNNEPESIVGKSEGHTTNGAIGWQTAKCFIPIQSSTIYWIIIYFSGTGGSLGIDRDDDYVGELWKGDSSSGGFRDPWAETNLTGTDQYLAFYALHETKGTGTYINIGDEWKAAQI